MIDTNRRVRGANRRRNGGLRTESDLPQPYTMFCGGSRNAPSCKDFRASPTLHE